MLCFPVTIEGANENHIISCQIEGSNTGVSITASIAGISPRNFISFTRFEGNTTNITLGSNVSDTSIVMPHMVDGTSLSDSGTRTQVIATQADKLGNSLVSAMAAATGTPFEFERTANGGSNVPAMRVVDSATSSGTPTTLQIETERATGSFIRGERGSTTYVDIRADGDIDFAGALQHLGS